jgi:putative membrane protein
MQVLVQHSGWGPGGWWPLIPIVWAVFWTVVVIVAVTVWRRRGAGWPGQPSAAAVLAERYARGEIDEDEFRLRLAVLKGMRS